MFMTLDGVAEFPIYPSTEPSSDDLSEDPMWIRRMPEIDTIVLGRNSYEKWARHWPAQLRNPKAAPFEKAFAAFSDDVKKVVFSKTLKSADWRNTVIVRGDPTDEVHKLQAVPGKNIALGGGPRLAQSFIERGLVDEMLLEVFPSVLGKGKPLFNVKPDPDSPEDFIPVGTPGRRDFKLLEAKALNDGTVFLHLIR